MIVVIADDLTGAAEIGGIGLKYDLTVEIITSASACTTPGADLIIISTDTRSMSEKHAVEKIISLTPLITRFKPGMIFKKIDSVLRGHVMAEVKTHLRQLELDRALLVPANPAFGRTLTNSNYFVNGVPIHQTSFAHDPEFPVLSSKVHDMLRVGAKEIHISAPGDKLMVSGIFVGECVDTTDLKAWANKDRDSTLLAGSAAFFAELLETLNPGKRDKVEEQTISHDYPPLFVCGSTHDTSRQLVRKAHECNGPVSYMPPEIIASTTYTDSLFEDWADEILSLLKIHKKAIVAVGEKNAPNTIISAADLRNKKAIVVEKIFQKATIKEILIEGGSTATAIINRLNLIRFFPVAEPAPGVIRMKVDIIDDLFLTVKPGSYKWPADTWNF